MMYRTTRGGSGEKRSAQAILQGIGEDRGLFVPASIPPLGKDPAALASEGYRAVAAWVLARFFDDFSEEEIRNCVVSAYDDKFEAEDIVPLVEAGDAWFLELFHGKTAAFKDMALSILPYLLTTAMRKEKEDKKVVILAATSGDTGKAALEGFADVDGTEIAVFYPSEGVSLVQERQMVTQEGANVKVFGIRGNFDDAQAGVKHIFNDAAMQEDLARRGYRLSSANSINIGRLVPQIAYYVWGYGRLVLAGAVRPGDPVNVAVPTGNFGNILAAYYAKRMGVPIGRLLCASNRNDVLADFLQTGVYDRNREFFVTSSPSMDILVSSNLERLLFHLAGDDGPATAALMQSLETTGRYEAGESIRAGLTDFYGAAADETATKVAIATLFQSHGYLTDTHTAVAYSVLRRYRAETGDGTPTLIASTASAYKFADAVLAALDPDSAERGFAAVDALERLSGVPVPACLRGLEDRAIRHTAVIDPTAMGETVAALYR